jgi:pyroglutamyl-peptidase
MSNMKVVLTGFGSFHGVQKNPTEEIIQEILNQKWIPENASSLTAQVIQVSSEASTQFINSTLKDYEEVVAIHLGVDSSSTCFKIEQVAYNNMTFRVPDERGFQPDRENIEYDNNFDQPIFTSIPTTTICKELQDCGYDVILSQDPGRYICNYIYYKSLCSSDKKISVFIHVPPAEIIPVPNQVKFVKDAVNFILNKLEVVC